MVGDFVCSVVVAMAASEEGADVSWEERWEGAFGESDAGLVGCNPVVH